MFSLFLLGNIASGKSTAARYLEGLGALRIDLDELARDLYVPGGRLVQEVADAFGWDVLDAEGGLRRPVLAERAFASPEQTARLDALVHPALMEQLALRLLPATCCTVSKPEFDLAVVEVSAPRGFELSGTIGLRRRNTTFRADDTNDSKGATHEPASHRH